MRRIAAAAVTEAVAELCIRANRELPPDIARALERAQAEETWPTAKHSLHILQENLKLAAEKQLPICQDTGLACVFLELGQEVYIDGPLEDAVQAGVRKGYEQGFLRKSVVCDPLRRVNTGDNTPAQLTVHLVSGDICRITVMPKGFGSENMSAVAMLKPADGVEGVKRFVLDTVRTAGPNPCPPMVIGVGIGGTFDRVTLLAKEALLRPVDEPHPDPFYAALERELLAEVNALGIGPQGFGGRTTALGLNIAAAPTHVAGLPAAVNINCHVTRRAAAEL